MEERKTYQEARENKAGEKKKRFRTISEEKVYPDQKIHHKAVADIKHT